MLQTVVIGLILSIFIEFLQLFFGKRISSVTAIINNTLGTAAGTLAAAVYLHTFSDSVNRNIRIHCRRRH